MESFFIGQIMMFGGNFAPRGWALCDGQLLPIAQNTALFSILGTIYGGDGRSTFALPDLRGSVPIQAGTGPGLRNYREGQRGGTEYNVLNTMNLPSHTHVGTISGSATVNVYEEEGNTPSAEGNNFANSTGDTFTTENTNAMMSIGNVVLNMDVQAGMTGGGQSINNMMPFGVVNYIICMEGPFPSRS